MSTGKEARFEVAPERMPEIAAAKMTEAQKQAAAEISAGPRGEVKGPFVALLAMVMNVARTGVPQGPSLPLAALPLRAKPL